MTDLSKPAQAEKAQHPRSMFQQLLAWMIDNPVAVNLLTLVLIVAGIYRFNDIEQQTSPAFKVDEIAIEASFPGATIKEIEQSIILPIEHRLQQHPSIERIHATAIAGEASITLSLNDGVDVNSMLADIKNQLDSISGLPSAMEPLQISVVEELEPLIELGLYGNLTETQLKAEAIKLKQALQAEFDIAQVTFEGARDSEVVIEVSQQKLIQHKLTLAQITDKVSQSVQDTSAGNISTNAGNIVIRTLGRKQQLEQFRSINIYSSATGASLTLGQIANVRWGFSQQEQPFLVNGQPAIMLVLYQNAQVKPVALSTAIKQYLNQYQAQLPNSSQLIVLDDQATAYQARTSLLLNNGLIGMVLVILALSLLLDARLALWVCMGIPVTLLGSLALMPTLNIPLNMVTLFAFIITLGILVDDAVIVAENIFQKLQQGMEITAALKLGVQQMALPVCFSVITNIIAFLPLLFVSGELGNMYQPMALLIFAIFAVSLIEALFILPYHLTQLAKPSRLTRVALLQQRSFALFEKLRDVQFKQMLYAALKQPWVVIVSFIAINALVFTWVGSGRVDSSFVPKVGSERIDVEVEFVAGSSLADKKRIMQHIEMAGIAAFIQLGEGGNYKHIMLSIEDSAASSTFQIPAEEQRQYSAREFVDSWRQQIGEVAGVKSLFFDFEVGPGGGKELVIELASTDKQALTQASYDLMTKLAAIHGVTDIDSGLIDAQREFVLDINQRGLQMGFSSQSLGELVRSSLYGTEVYRQIQNSEELKVRVLRDKQEQFKVNQLANLIVSAPTGQQVLLGQVATIKPLYSATKIERVDGIEQVEVSASVIRSQANISLIVDKIADEILPEISTRYPKVALELGGSARTERKVNGNLVTGTLLALFLVFAFLAIYFKNSLDALLVLSVIPLCLAAAMLGHILLGYSFSVMSLFGMIALSGLVVNGSFVLLLEIKRNLTLGLTSYDAVIQASLARFRPVAITAITTAVGLAPLLFETSVQAQYLIPMAISLSFGTLFSIATILVYCPALFYLAEQWRAKKSVNNDIRALVLN
ncbi:efflux RND transporter permease subunit [Shewanella fidelis]|uniref:Efflux RND transporter permease subunit n=1 Tax=Shewanella fidelis TaxID=173509 RepID=A0AAW8NH97_9GAMM|nr:efflux RND transporter permease subunit [Shewanella fidelis]MDR8522728.1 efflux RND transporter permease subunit [Shewanella fidelis]MDW4812343.1 efflux RND transporter permease subunit [Shewanella fidelis]MDW4815992.1 efflux RND transporter permease subunit [Shewanella fidelis]MDW4820584.1 efflux RND transporter permease subunit [Shewanella fidelis]MDW4824807.1 efflux RND transporter permease subunit [Shewanella fidelis]